MSKGGKYICVCHRSIEGERGVFQIHDVQLQRLKKTLPEVLENPKLFESQEILASAFNPRDERMIITLTGQPDLNLILWHWENGKIITHQ